MKFPCLILEKFCKTELSLILETEGVSEEGAPISSAEWSGKCNYQSQAKKVYTDKKVWVAVTGTCLIPGDVAPNLAVISSGTATLFGETRKIVSGAKLRNPDGSVNYTRIEVE